MSHLINLYKSHDSSIPWGARDASTKLTQFPRLDLVGNATPLENCLVYLIIWDVKFTLNVMMSRLWRLAGINCAS